jgi:predicted GIY-YIG superfamily endonuclease
MDPGWVYIVTNKPQGVLYIGVTSDLEGRIWEHRNGIHHGFAYHDNCSRLEGKPYADSPRVPVSARWPDAPADGHVR